MAHQKGSTSIVGVGEETTFGTAATTGFLLEKVSDTVSGQFSRNASAVLSGNRNPTVPYAGNKSVSGDIVVPVDDEAFWYWLQLAFGDPTTTGSADPWTHIFKIGNTQPSFTHTKYFGELATPSWFEAVGCKISSMSIDFGGDGELLATFGVVGADETIETSTPFSVAETTVSVDEKYNNFNAAINEGGGASTQIKSFSFNVDFGLDTGQRTISGGGSLASIPEGKVAVSGNIKGIFADTTLISKGLNSTESSLELVLTSAVTASHLLTFDINELLYDYKSPPIDGPQGIDIDLNYEGYYQGDAAASAIMITNLNASAHA